MARGPRVVAAFVKTHLRVADAADGLGERLQEELAPERRAGIEKARRIAWIPIGHHVEFVEALFAAGPRAAARETCRQAVLETLGQPLLRPLFTGALAIVGSDFGRFVTWTPEAWSALFREVGRLRWEPGDALSGALVLERPDPRVAASQAWVEGLAGAISALFDATQHTGEITTIAARERIELRVRWQREPSPR